MRVQVPEGYGFSKVELEIARLMDRCGFLRYREKPFSLTSGVSSHFYCGDREDITDNPSLEWILGTTIASLIKSHAVAYQDNKTQCLIGVPTAGTALAQAGAMVGAKANNFSGFCHRLMREKKQSNGWAGWVSGKPSPTTQTAWLVDNAITTGASFAEAAERLREDGYHLEDVKVFVVVDREQGGINRVRTMGFRQVITAFKLRHLVYALVQLGCWPESRYGQLEEELHCYQFS